MKRIDVHHHILPPEYVERMGAQAIGSPSTSGSVPPWSRERALETLDAHGIARAITSISAPGVKLSDDAATRRLARACNEYAARLGQDHPERFGSFASLPLPDVDASIREADYALDTLKAQGIVLMTNYADRYLGDPAFAPLFEHLNARQAVVFVHPTTCSCAPCHPDASASLLEFPFDTTRTMVSLLFARAFERFSAIRFIFSHAGGALPFLAGRIAGLSARNPRLQAGSPLDVMAVLRGLYYDSALSTSRPVFAALCEVASLDRILFGTDYPFAPQAAVGTTVAELQGLGLGERELAMVECENARELFGWG